MTILLPEHEAHILGASGPLCEKIIGSARTRLLLYPGFPGINENIPLLRFLAAAGIECHLLSYAGTRKSQGSFSFIAALGDAQRAMQKINPAIVIGYSYGAVYAWHASRFYPPVLLCLLEPITDVEAIWSYYTQSHNGYMTQLMREASAVARGDWQLWMQEQTEMILFSPIYGPSPDTRIITIHGDKDTEIPLAMSEQFCSERGVPLRIISGCGHYLDGYHDAIGRIILDAYTMAVREMDRKPYKAAQVRPFHGEGHPCSRGAVRRRRQRQAG